MLSAARYPASENLDDYKTTTAELVRRTLLLRSPPDPRSSVYTQDAYRTAQRLWPSFSARVPDGVR